MIKEKSRNEKGISLVTLSIAIIIMLIITSVLIFNSNTGTSTKKLNNMYQDIYLLKDKIALYYIKYIKLPTIDTAYTNIEDIQSINVNDNQNYYVIDLEALENITLNYGKDYNAYKANQDMKLEDVYVINEQSHNIYYIKGIKFDTKTYHTIPGDYTKVEVPTISKISMLSTNANKATVLIKATNPNVGIKSIDLYLEGQVYKTFEYDEKPKSIEEAIEVSDLIFYQGYHCYYKITDENGNETQSNQIQIRNEDTISTKEDLKALATQVNEGNNFSTKTVQLLNDIDLQGNINNMHIPIGNDSNRFEGNFNGHGYTIKNLYLNSGEYEFAGLFGVLGETGMIQNVVLENCYISTTNKDVGGICGSNYGKIVNCGVSGNIYSKKILGQTQQQREIGGIAGISYGEITRCYNRANIECVDGVYIGGIAGITFDNATILNSYNTGNLTNIYADAIIHFHIGGITGLLGKETSKVENCYNTSTITMQQESTNLGGIVAFNGGYSHAAGSIVNSYCSDTNTYAYYLDGVTGKEDGKISLDEIRQESFVTRLGSSYRKDVMLNDGMYQYNEGYPVLEWEIKK